MKKPIIVTGLIASSMLNINAKTSNNLKNNITTEVYQWLVETESDVFSGTCLTIDDVNKEIQEKTNNSRVLKKSIKPVSLKEKVYAWNVVTDKGHASGVVTSLTDAKNAIDMFGDQKIIESNIIESYNI